MKDELIFKIGVALSKSIEEECQVVYILAEIGKLLDRMEEKKAYPILWMFRSWAVHPYIHDVSPLDSLFNRLEEALSDKDKRPQVILDMADFTEFRGQIIKFLQTKGISNKFNEEDYWVSFRTNFLKIIKDCPLVITGRSITKIYFKDSDNKEVNFVFKFSNGREVLGQLTFN